MFSWLEQDKTNLFQTLEYHTILFTFTWLYITISAAQNTLSESLWAIEICDSLETWSGSSLHCFPAAHANDTPRNTHKSPRIQRQANGGEWLWGPREHRCTVHSLDLYREARNTLNASQNAAQSEMRWKSLSAIRDARSLHLAPARDCVAACHWLIAKRECRTPAARQTIFCYEWLWRLRPCFFPSTRSARCFDPRVASLGFEPCLIAAPPVFFPFSLYTHNALSNAAAAYMEIGDAPPSVGDQSVVLRKLWEKGSWHIVPGVS